MLAALAAGGQAGRPDGLPGRRAERNSTEQSDSAARTNRTHGERAARQRPRSGGRERPIAREQPTAAMRLRVGRWTPGSDATDGGGAPGRGQLRALEPRDPRRATPNVTTVLRNSHTGDRVNPIRPWCTRRHYDRLSARICGRTSNIRRRYPAGDRIRPVNGFDSGNVNGVERISARSHDMTDHHDLLRSVTHIE